MDRHLGTIADLPKDLCERVLTIAGETGKIKLLCAALLGQPRGLCSSSPDVLWAAFSASWRAGLEDCCLDIMLHSDSPMLTCCGARYSELLYGFIEPFHDRLEEAVGLVQRVNESVVLDTRLFRSDQMMRAYFLTVDPDQRLPQKSLNPNLNSTLAQVIRTSSAYFRYLGHTDYSVLSMCVKAHNISLRMGWPNVQEGISAIRSLFTDGLCDRVSLETSLDAFILCIDETWGIIVSPCGLREGTVSSVQGTLHLLLTLDARLVEREWEEELERVLNDTSASRLLRSLRSLCRFACGAFPDPRVPSVANHYALAFLCDRHLWDSAAGRVCWKRSRADEELSGIIDRGRCMQETAQSILRNS